jgi:hypothetical protein
MLVAPPHGVVDVAIQRASDVTGIDFSFLLGTAGRESGYNPKARAPTSSAAGLFQFVDQTWLATLKRHGARYGYARYAALIEKGPDGRYRTRDEAGRTAVMALRLDPRAASLMAGEMAGDHASLLHEALGRAPSAGELYAAHFLGPQGAARMIALARTRPDAAAAAQFPDAARANPTIFRCEGRPSTVAELYSRLTGRPEPIARTNAGPDAFLHYAAARQAERARLQHAVIEAALQRRKPTPKILTSAPTAGSSPTSKAI